MIIDLPKKFKYEGKERIKDGILTIPFKANFRDFMYKLTLANKGKRCWYCGRQLKDNEITMDHLYPQDLGGPTIPNNLAPSCSKCNSQKGNITEKQYRQLVEAPRAKKRLIKSKIDMSNQWKKSQKGYFLPKGWISSKPIENIWVNMIMSENYRGKKYDKIEAFFKEYGHLQCPIIVDRNNYLLDGFMVLMFAKNNNISQIPAIVLENVEVELK